jgi:hypothetical protein
MGETSVSDLHSFYADPDLAFSAIVSKFRHPLNLQILINYKYAVSTICVSFAHLWWIQAEPLKYCLDPELNCSIFIFFVLKFGRQDPQFSMVSGAELPYKVRVLLLGCVAGRTRCGAWAVSAFRATSSAPACRSVSTAPTRITAVGTVYQRNINIFRPLCTVLRIRKYFFRIRIREAINLYFGFGSGRPSNDRSGRIRILPGHFL